MDGEQLSLFDFKTDEGFYENLGKELGKLVDNKQQAYGNSMSKSIKVLKAFLSDYRNDNFYGGYQTCYVIPESLLEHLLIMVRIIDKQCRIFSNPDGDLMGESPYKDIAGYGLLGTSRSPVERVTK